MIIVTSFKSFCYGLGLTSFAVCVSYAIARWGFENLWYMAQLLPTFMTFYVLLAWLMYLRKTNFLGWKPNSKVPDMLGHHESELTKDLPEDKISGKELILVKDDSGLIQRRPVGTDAASSSQESLIKNPTPVLLWSAVQLALLATYLYKAYGIGAYYHLTQ